MTSLGNRAKVLLLDGILMTTGPLSLDQAGDQAIADSFGGFYSEVGSGSGLQGEGAGLWFIFGLSWACISAVLVYVSN